MSVTEAQLNSRLKALRIARKQFRECLAEPLRVAMMQRSPLATASHVWNIPTECAAAGFRLEMVQGKAGWSVSLTRMIDTETEFGAAGEAKSLLKALFQLTDAAEQRFEGMEADARHQLVQIETAAPVAA